jgi:hypothetical protein
MKNQMRKSFLWIALAAPLGFAADGKTIATRDGVCQVTVPANWLVGSIGSMADSPDKKVSAIVSSPKMVDSFPEAKQTAKTVYKNSKVVKDSATEFEMEGKSITDKPDVYRLIPVAGNKFCIAEVQYQAGTVDDARKIVETLKSGK